MLNLNILYHILELSVCEYRQFLIRTFSLTIYIGFCHNYIFPPPLVKVEGFFITLSEHASKVKFVLNIKLML